MCPSHQSRVGLEPATHTVASGSSSALEWYMRAYDAVPADVHVWALGVHDAVWGNVGSANVSAFRCAVVESLKLVEPPSVRILPLGSSTAFMVTRGTDIGCMVTQNSLLCPRSMHSTVLVAPCVLPPKITTRGRYPSLGSSGRSTDDP